MVLYQRSSLRYAHTNGHTELTYTEDGESIVTCGSDGDIRKWQGIDDDDPTSTCLGESVVCIAHTGGRLLAATDRNTVQAYTFETMDKDGTLMRFTAQATCICVSQTIMAAGSDDQTIKVIKGVNENAQPEVQMQGHKGPILSLDVSVQKSLLASVSGDGMLKIWNLETGAEVKNIVGLPKVNCFESAVSFGTPRFEPRQGNSLAYVKGKEIFVLNTSTWEVQFTLSDERVTGDFTCCAFSSDGALLAAGTTSGAIAVFDFVRTQVIKCEAASSECQAITCMAWKPGSNDELAYCDATGQLGTLFSSGGEMGDGADEGADENVDFGDLEFDKDDRSVGQPEMDGDDEDDDDGDGVSIEKLKNRIMNPSRMNGGDTHHGDDDDDTKDSLPHSMRSAIEAQFVPTTKLFKQQAPFQPSATPSHLEHRYLAWNDVGIVCAHADSSDGSIDVEFHDASVHHALHIPNYNNHNMASLSSSVLALSSEGATKMVCIALAASGNKEWTAPLPDCESVEALIATSKLVGVATSMGFLRLFTVMGTQREILSIPGPVVAMAGYEDRLLVCYHASAPREKQQHIAALLVQTHGLQLRSQQLTVPLPAGRQLTWLGFSDCGSPAFGDSMGLVQLFSVKSNCWYPICDTLKQSSSVSNNYFVIAISERQQIVQAVMCRGSSYPMTNPRPMLQELAMHMPMCDSDTEKSELEDALVRVSIMDATNSDKIVKETAIKLFALACRSELENRAKELIETIACPELLSLAVKYASKLGRIHLSDKLYELMPQLEERSEFRPQEPLPVSPFVHAASSPYGTAVSNCKLAPKAMELSSAKRAPFKRFTLNNTPTSLKKPKEITSGLATPTAISSADDSQENNPEPDSELEPPSPALSKVSGDESKELTRTPLNSVNPFAAKRKLGDVDKSSPLLGSGKFKFAKK